LTTVRMLFPAIIQSDETDVTLIEHDNKIRKASRIKYSRMAWGPCFRFSTSTSQLTSLPNNAFTQTTLLRSHFYTYSDISKHNHPLLVKGANIVTNKYSNLWCQKFRLLAFVYMHSWWWLKTAKESKPYL